jgi:phosphoglycerate dehydrogenase-like enzyme
MTILYASRTEKGIPGATRVELDHLLRDSDIVLVAAPLNAETRGMIGDSAFELMKDDAILVNIARGPLVDTNALVRALSRAAIGGAALDVTDPEPLPADHALLGFPNCLVVPHIGSASVRARRAMARLAVDNLVAVLRGEVMPAAFSPPETGSAGEHHQETS